MSPREMEIITNKTSLSLSPSRKRDRVGNSSTIRVSSDRGAEDVNFGRHTKRKPNSEFASTSSVLRIDSTKDTMKRQRSHCIDGVAEDSSLRRVKKKNRRFGGGSSLSSASSAAFNAHKVQSLSLSLRFSYNISSYLITSYLLLL